MKKKDKLNTITLYNEQAQKDRYGHNSTTATHYTTKKIKKHEVPGLADFPFFSSRNPRGFLEESSKIMHEEVGGVSSFRPPNW